MKTMTCKQLGGACGTTFTAANFDEIAAMSRSHGAEMFQAGDQPHIDAMNAMMDLMKDPAAMQEWMESKRKEFEALPVAE